MAVAVACIILLALGLHGLLSGHTGQAMCWSRTSMGSCGQECCSTGFRHVINAQADRPQASASDAGMPGAGSVSRFPKVDHLLGS